ncbi:DNA internalization-related competence protein ComEC/Rec2 [Bacillus sp. FJAT-49732]|uniref:DNA internalization-related competence protein ComEC/Rec2 n=1 Tax=Lederbergia citrisecunda TaxID=2833583 RepID=A0A942TLC7_9BACI|nr:DNA internalization-related competence protein ComEC/Rec2 [Lederbergia citrisecunda]MBS4199735.1 DNA internalization-related competence protein ComEC/Rec2 [Lederbergia citrisecunda]
MATGSWFFAAIAAISGVMIIFEFHILTLILISMGMIRIIFERRKNLFLFFCTFFIFFMCLAFLTKQHNISIFEHGKTNMHVTFNEFPQIDGDRLKAVVVSDQEKLLLSYKIQSELEKSLLESNIRSGATCFISGDLIQPEPNRNEYTFNYEQFLYRQNIHWLLDTDRIDGNECYYSKQSIKHHLQNIREKGVRFVDKSFPDILIPYANALIFGDRTSFSEDTYRSYQQIGVVHLLAISGLHIAFFVGLIYIIFLRLGITKETIYWILMIILPIYTIISGLNPPVIRAVLMTLLLLSSKKWRLPITTLDALSITFILFLLFDPFLIYHAGFQLSFCVTFCLIISSKAIFLNNHTYIRKMVDISIVSTLASFPILIFHFFEFSVIGILANVIFVPFYTTIILPSMLSLFIIKFFSDGLFSLFAELIAVIVSYSEQFALIISSFKFSTIITGKPNTISLIFMVVGAYLYVFLTEHKRPRIVAILPLMTILLIHMAVIQFSPKGEVFFIDIGQGDSTLIKLPYNRGTYLIDTGGQLEFPIPDWRERKKPFQVGKQMLLPVLKSKGIHTIDKLILTHSDADHIGAAKDLFGEIAIKEIYISPNSWDISLMEIILNLAKKYRVPIYEVKAGTGWENKSGTFHIIFPLDDHYEGNNSSLVLFASFGKLVWLFMGDVEKEGEKEIIEAYQKLNADVIKVGHHGSKTSSTIEFIKFINPDYAVISAGYNNRYGHPHQEVLDVLKENKVHVYRTDEHGGIHYVFTKRGGTFHTIMQ